MLSWFAAGVRRRLAPLLDLPWLRWSWILPGCTNHKEIRVFALRRSGHHAIINWIRYQFRGRHCFLNACSGSGNPFCTCVPSQSRVKYWLGEHNRLFWDNERAGRHSKKGLLIYNYEDAYLEDICTAEFERQRDSCVGKSKRRIDVLVLRDPYNWLASRLRWARGTQYAPSLESFAPAMKLWKDHANEFLGNTNLLKNKVAISYNRWFVDPRYRQDIAERLDLPFTDAGLNRVARFGPNLWGDSFDGLRFDGQAQKMDVLSRWRQFKRDDFYLQLLSDREICKLSEAIFGKTEAQAELCAAR